MQARLLPGFLLFLLLLPPASLPAQTTWEWLNPLPQVNDLHDVAFRTASDLVAVGARGSIVVSSDGGGAWRNVAGGVERNLNAVSFHDPLVGLAVGDDGSVVGTTDGGATWRVKSPPQGVSDYEDIDFASATVAVAVGDDGIVRSTDGGDTWRRVPAQMVGSLITVAFADEQIAVAGGKGGELLRSTNGGQNWSIIPDVSGRLMDVEFASPTVGWAVTDGYAAGNVLRTTDAGLTWTDAYPDLHDSISAIALLDATTAAILIPGDGEIRRTTDGGKSWSRADIVKRSYYEYLSAMDVSAAGQVVVVGQVGQIYTAPNLGGAWQLRLTGPLESLEDVAFSGPLNGLAVGAFGRILKTTDGGTTWIDKASGLLTTLSGVTFLDPATAIAVGADGVLLRSTDAGETWALPTNGLQTDFNAIARLDPLHSVVVGDGGDIVTTSDGGASWNRRAGGLPSDSTGDLLDLSFYDASVGCAVGPVGKIIVTTDGGATWSVRASGALEWPLVSVVMTAPGTITAIARKPGNDGAVIMRSSDAGGSWDSVYGAVDHDPQTYLDPSLSDIRALDEHSLAAVGEEAVWSGDGGRTWSTLPRPAAPLRAAAFVKEESSVLTSIVGVGPYGAIIRLNEARISDAPRNERPGGSGSELSCRVLPNPIGEAGILRLHGPTAGHASVRLYDLLGREVALLYEGDLEAGGRAVEWRPGGLAEGIYLYRCTMNGSVASGTVAVRR